MARTWSREDIADLAVQQLIMHEDHPDECPPPWEDSLASWRESASQAGDEDTVEAIDTVPDAADIYEQAAQRLRVEDFDGLRRSEILAKLVADDD